MTPPDFSSLSDDEFRAKAREFFAQHYPSHLRFILRRARLALVAATRQVLANGLAVLGVSAPERM